MFGRKRRGHLQVRDRIILARQFGRAVALQQLADDLCVFRRAQIAVVVRRGVAERDQVVAEAARQHVERDAPVMQMGDRGDHLRDRVGMHVDRLHRDQRHQPLRVLDHDLRHQPRIDQAVVGVDQHALAMEFLAPLRDVDHLPHIVAPVDVLGLRACRVDADAAMGYGIVAGHFRCLRRTFILAWLHGSHFERSSVGAVRRDRRGAARKGSARCAGRSLRRVGRCAGSQKSREQSACRGRAPARRRRSSMCPASRKRIPQAGWRHG